MIKNYIIFRYNFQRNHWEEVFSTYIEKIAKLKYRQFKVTYPYFNYILREEVIIHEEH